MEDKVAFLSRDRFHNVKLLSVGAKTSPSAKSIGYRVQVEKYLSSHNKKNGLCLRFLVGGEYFSICCALHFTTTSTTCPDTFLMFAIVVLCLFCMNKLEPLNRFI